MMDFSTLVIRLCEDTREDWTPEEIHVVQINDLTEGELERTVSEILRNHKYTDGYRLTYTVGRFEWGASSIWDQLFLDLSLVIAAGAAEGIVRGCVDHFLAKKSAHQEAETQISTEEQLKRLTELASTAFGVPTRLLRRVGFDIKGSSVVAVFEDHMGNQYEVEQAGPNYCHFKLLKRADPPDADQPD